jgi:hypothetical protein
MQAHGGPQRDLSAQVAMMAAKTRPWKSIISLVLAIAAAGASGWAHSYFPRFFAGGDVVSQIVAAATAVAFCLFASAATIGLSGKVRDVLQPVAGASHASVVRYALVLIGAVTTLVVTLVLFGVPVGQLLVGGALTSVFVGIAAQQALSNVFAGMVLLLASPFRVGDAIRLRAGSLGGPVEGTVSEIGITYLRVATSDGMLSVPNSQVLNAVVGPLPPGADLAAPAQSAPAPAAPGTAGPGAAVIAPAVAASQGQAPADASPGTGPAARQAGPPALRLHRCPGRDLQGQAGDAEDPDLLRRGEAGRAQPLP